MILSVSVKHTSKVTKRKSIDIKNDEKSHPSNTVHEFNYQFVLFSFLVSTSSSRPIDDSSVNLTHPSLPPPHIVINISSTNLPMTSTIPRNDSSKSISSQAESFVSAIAPTMEKNLLATDSSSYASVNDQCLSTSSSSYHTAIADDRSSSSSMTGYETPTPQLDDQTLSSHSSISDLSHAETLEPNAEGN